MKDLFFAGLSAFGFILLFNGSPIDALIGFMIGILVRWIENSLSEMQMNNFFTGAIAAAALTWLTLLLNSLGLVASSETVIIGVMMLLVPGLAITNAVRDSIAGDLISGLARAAEALLIAVSVALGNGVGMMIWMWMGGIIR